MEQNEQKMQQQNEQMTTNQTNDQNTANNATKPIESEMKKVEENEHKNVENVVEEEEDSAGIHALLLASRDEDKKEESVHLDDDNNANDMSEDDEIDKKNIEHRKNVNYDGFAAHTVNVKGDNIPCAIKTFSDCLSEHECAEQILKNLEREQFAQPTPIQQHCLPILMDNRDVISIAQTGSGKTLAFLVPIITQLMITGEVNRVFFAGSKSTFVSPLALIMAPTRELCIQIDEQVYKMTRDLWIRSFAVFGGQNYEDQAKQIEKFQVDILCATPGRLLDMVDGCKVSLEYVKHLAFDEADKMMDNGFDQKVIQIVNKRYYFFIVCVFVFHNVLMCSKRNAG